MVKLREEPCTRCGWRFDTFHICVDLSGPEPELPPEKKRSRRRNGSMRRHANSSHHGYGGPEKQTPEWRAAISEGMQDYLAELREKNKDRNETIVSLYANGSTFRQIATEMGLSYFTVSRVLNLAKDEGLIDIRPPAHLRATRDKE